MPPEPRRQFFVRDSLHTRAGLDALSRAAAIMNRPANTRVPSFARCQRALAEVRAAQSLIAARRRRSANVNVLQALDARLAESGRLAGRIIALRPNPAERELLREGYLKRGK